MGWEHHPKLRYLLVRIRVLVLPSFIKENDEGGETTETEDTNDTTFPSLPGLTNPFM